MFGSHVLECEDQEFYSREIVFLHIGHCTQREADYHTYIDNHIYTRYSTQQKDNYTPVSINVTIGKSIHALNTALKFTDIDFHSPSKIGEGMMNAELQETYGSLTVKPGEVNILNLSLPTVVILSIICSEALTLHSVCPEWLCRNRV